MKTIKVLSALTMLVGLPAAAGAQTFPADNEWVPVTINGQVATDVADDANGSLDIVGNQANPAAYIGSDTTHFYFRLRLDDDPTLGTPLRDFGWGAVLNFNNNRNNYEALAIVDGGSTPEEVVVWENQPQMMQGSPRDPAENRVADNPVTTHARAVLATSMFSNDEDYFIDWAVSRVALGLAGRGVGDPMSMVFGTSTVNNALDADILGVGNTLDELLTDPLDCGFNGCQVPDDDGDGVPNSADNCPDDANADQADMDNDGEGDVCDGDIDGDMVPNNMDNCPTAANMNQADNDNDDDGDVCDDDDDDDGVADADDNCPLIANADQADADSNGVGDACEDDQDGDGVADAQDNCPMVANADQADGDNDGLGDACDDDMPVDSDNDGVLDGEDNCPTVPNANQADEDNNGIGDACEGDADSDTILDVDEGDADEDTDEDGTPNAEDLDSDGDTISDADEAGDADPRTPPVDTDGDGIPDFKDLDSDGDGIPDAEEAGDDDLETPPVDTDGDGIPDFQDPVDDSNNGNNANNGTNNGNNGTNNGTGGTTDGNNEDDLGYVVTGGCSSVDGGAALAPTLLFGFVALGRRRRRNR